MTDMIERTLNRPGQQLHSYSMPGDSNCAATKALSAKPVDHRSPPTYTDFEETGTTASGGERSMKLFWLAGFFASIISPLHAQERKEVTITPLLSSTVIASRRAEQQESSRLIALVSPNDIRQLAKRYRVRFARQGE
jgi:hypothetical protein